MGRFTALLLAQLIATSLACLPTSNSGRPFGIDLGPNTEVYPYYKDGEVGITFEWRFKRSIENETAHDIDISRKLFEVLDINDDDQLDVKEWFDEGGKVRSFSDMLGDYDNNSDEMISLEEFLAIPLDPATIDHEMRSDQN
ncbi:uncharacterized protein LOC105438199 [Strongylocentrotus purpuratus]|uniref:Uncharacterized protein n=1 Tax=Strongylocentrotus purpuratus TaxID=7668 RepID=A0A7M7HD29_STRPU|nr:uncharacterized protein LOC105438199 [Strongylocentrotus purpuratus]|eukprot:XP_011664021.1 PREDICTED: uncharacterized protein LOC105438199 [Strongylocentrotus purpuratus]